VAGVRWSLVTCCGGGPPGRGRMGSLGEEEIADVSVFYNSSMCMLLDVGNDEFGKLDPVPE
jgi:hypothetical protein